MSDLAQWLTDQGLAQHIQTFAKHDIDFNILPELTDQDLKELGISLGHRKRLHKAIAAMANTPAAPPQAATPSVTINAHLLQNAERRQLTVMFCDLVDSTTLANQFDPEDLREIMNSFRTCCEHVTQRFDGFIARYMGDGLLVYFGYPQANEHSVEQAVHAGLAVITAVSALRPKGDTVVMQTRVGIATGEVVIGGLIGTGSAQEQAVAGNTLNLAARLQNVAQPDQVVIAETTKNLLGGLFHYLDLGTHRLKGFSKPQAVWQVVRESAILNRFEVNRSVRELSPLVGRESELDLLLHRWHHSCDGEGQVVLLDGEPGIGKSRLAAALCQSVSTQPHTLLRYYCTPRYRDSALYPIINHLQMAAQIQRYDSHEAKLNKLAALLASTGPTEDEEHALFATLLALPYQTRYPPLTLTPQQQREKVFAALEKRLLRIAEQLPVLMVFEDIHWIDPTTLDFLGRWVNWLHPAAVLLLATTRPDFSPPWSESSHFTHLTLTPLNRQDATHMLSHLTSGKALPTNLREQIFTETDGVPLFVEELTKTVLESPTLRDDGDHYTLTKPWSAFSVPCTLKDSLLARLDRFSPLKEIAQLGAVLGRQFSYELIHTVCELAQPSLANALTQLAAADILMQRGQVPATTYTFKHALLRDAAYESLLKSKRKVLHGKIAKAIAQDRSLDSTNADLTLAYHCEKAEDVAAAIKHLIAAGRNSSTRMDIKEGRRTLEYALSLLPQCTADQHKRFYELEIISLLCPILTVTEGNACEQASKLYSRGLELCRQLPDQQRGAWFSMQSLHCGWAMHYNTGHHHDCLDAIETGLKLYQNRRKTSPFRAEI